MRDDCRKKNLLQMFNSKRIGLMKSRGGILRTAAARSQQIKILLSFLFDISSREIIGRFDV